LPLKDGINPAWITGVAALQAQVIKPLLGDKASLTEAEWTTVCAKFDAFDAWVAGKAGAAVEKLGLKRVREILASKARKTSTPSSQRQGARSRGQCDCRG